MIDQLVLDLLKSKDDAARRQLWRTMHAIDEALQHLGWELAEANARQHSGEKAARNVRRDADKHLARRSS